MSHEREGHESVWHHEGRDMRVYSIMMGRALGVYGTGTMRGRSMRLYGTMKGTLLCQNM